MNLSPRSVTLIVVTAVVVVGAALVWTAPTADAAGASATVRQAYKELFDLSAKEGKGLVLYVDGQQIVGVVTKLIGNDAVELHNRELSRIVVRLDRIDGVAAP